MRIKITLESIGEQVIDINYNYSLSSLIYNLLRESDQGYSSFLHDSGYELNNKNYKLFVFSMLFPDRYRVEGSDMIIGGSVAFYVSSPKRDFLLGLVNSVTGYPELRINRGLFKVKNVEVVMEPQYTRCMNFKCLSPVTIATAYLNENSRLKKIDLYIEDKKFAENIRLNVLSKYELIYGSRPEDTQFDIHFKDIGRYKRGKLINYKDNIRIKGYLAPFEVSGNPELIKTAFECGIGDRNSLGMGMIEVAGRR